jgi:hypothetical protein
MVACTYHLCSWALSLHVSSKCCRYPNCCSLVVMTFLWLMRVVLWIVMYCAVYGWPRAYARGYMSPSTLSFIYWPWASVMEQKILEDKCCHGHRCYLVVVALWLSSPRPD